MGLNRPPSHQGGLGGYPNGRSCTPDEPARFGGGRWLLQFIHGFSIAGTLSQSGLFPIDPDAVPPLLLPSVLKGAMARFRSRSHSSGYLFQDALWEEATDQVSKGRLAPPLPFGADGGIACFRNEIPTRPSDFRSSKWVKPGHATTLNTDASSCVVLPGRR